MTPEEKAIEIYKKFWPSCANNKATQECAIICVEQIIDGIKRVDDYLESITNYDISDHIKYYEEVLEHIKNS